MSIIIGTRSGVYRVSGPDLESVERVLDDVRVFGMARHDGTQYLATPPGVYRSDDGEQTWELSEFPVDQVTSVAVSPDGSHVYAGTMPEHLFVSNDAGETWSEVEAIQEIPSFEKWFQIGGHDSHVREIQVHPDVPDRVVIGVDGGGVHVSDDRGETWETRMTGVPQYIHDILTLGPETWVAATDAGVFWTWDGGEWWDYVYYDEHMEHRYFRGVFGDRDVVYAGGARAGPEVWNREGSPRHAGFYEIHLGEETRTKTIEAIDYPGEPREAVLCGTTFDGNVLAGTTGGRLLRRLDDGSWESALTFPGEVQLREMLHVDD